MCRATMVCLLASLLKSCRGASCHVMSCESGHVMPCRVTSPHVVEKRSLTGVVDQRRSLLSCHVGSSSHVVDTRAVDPCCRLQSLTLAVGTCLWTPVVDNSRLQDGDSCR